MSLILLNMKKEQLHRMVLSTFLLKMSLIYVALYLSNSGHYFKEKGSVYVRWLGEEEVRVVLSQKVWSLHKCSITYAHTENWHGVEVKGCSAQGTPGLPQSMTDWRLGFFLSVFPHDKPRLALPLETPERLCFL